MWTLNLEKTAQFSRDYLYCITKKTYLLVI